MIPKDWRYRQAYQPDIIIDGDTVICCFEHERKRYWKKKNKN